MNNNRLILVISAIFTLLLSLPRLIYLLSSKNEPDIPRLFEVSIEDTLVRFILLFFFSFVVLKFNLLWIEQVRTAFKAWLRIVANALILAVWIAFFHLISEFVYDIHASVLSPVMNSIVYTFFLLVLVLISYAIRLVNDSKRDKIEKGILKQKSLESELVALRNQLNPHFLFNSLNTLSLLVREDQRAAGTFINKLSFLFRYILLSQDQTLVTVEQELKVLDSYIHLIEQRYKENIKVHVDISDRLINRKIPILAMQILMENAVKHNEISDNKPLYIEFVSENDWIVVRNDLQRRIGNIESTNTGLKNLNTRSEIQMGKEIEISIDATHFTVKLPTA